MTSGYYWTSKAENTPAHSLNKQTPIICTWLSNKRNTKKESKTVAWRQLGLKHCLKKGRLLKSPSWLNNSTYLINTLLQSMWSNGRTAKLAAKYIQTQYLSQVYITFSGWMQYDNMASCQSTNLQKLCHLLLYAIKGMNENMLPSSKQGCLYLIHPPGQTLSPFIVQTSANCKL